MISDIRCASWNLRVLFLELFAVLLVVCHPSEQQIVSMLPWKKPNGGYNNE
jgi:hypothetical protein